MPVFYVRCLACNHKWEMVKQFRTGAECPNCKSDETVTLMPLMKRPAKAKDPYDMINDNTGSKPIKSFAKDHRKGGKDTT